MRTILHVDLNNFYASVECLYNPSLRNKPVAVAGDPANRHGIILAKTCRPKTWRKNRRSHLAGKRKSSRPYLRATAV